MQMNENIQKINLKLEIQYKKRTMTYHKVMILPYSFKILQSRVIIVCQSTGFFILLYLFDTLYYPLYHLLYLDHSLYFFWP